MNLDQVKAMAERFAYGIAMVILMRFVAKGWLDQAMAEYLAGGFVMLIGGFIAWWKSRPQTLLDRAQAVMPGNDTKLNVVPASTASAATVTQIQTITNAANANVDTKLAV